MWADNPAESGADPADTDADELNAGADAGARADGMNAGVTQGPVLPIPVRRRSPPDNPDHSDRDVSAA